MQNFPLDILMLFYVHCLLQVERLEVEKQLLERANSSLEEKSKVVTAKNDLLNRNNRDLKDENATLRLENDRLKRLVRIKSKSKHFL